MLCLVRRLRILTSPLVRRRRSDDLERSGSSSLTTPRDPHTSSSRRPPARQQRSDRRSSRQRWSRWQGCRVERRREGLGRRVEIPSRQGPSPTSRSRSPRSRSCLAVNDQLAAAALPERHTPRQTHDGVTIDVRSRRSRRVQVRHAARDHPRSPRSRARLEMREQWAAAALSERQKAFHAASS